MGVTILLSLLWIALGAIVLMEPQRPVCVEPVSDFPLLGRFVIRDLQPYLCLDIVTTFRANSNPPPVAFESSSEDA